MKYREFMISEADLRDDEVVCSVGKEKHFPDRQFIHVIEYSAVKSLSDELAGEIHHNQELQARVKELELLHVYEMEAQNSLGHERIVAIEKERDELQIRLEDREQEYDKIFRERERLYKITGQMDEQATKCGYMEMEIKVLKKYLKECMPCTCTRTPDGKLLWICERCNIIGL